MRQIMTSHRIRQTLAAHLAALASACCWTTPGQAAEAAPGCPGTEATNLGLVMDQVHAHDVIRFESDAMATRIGGLVARLNAAAAAPMPLRVLVYNDLEWNAFSSPPGSIYLSAALVAAANDDELAWAMAHEMAHLERCDHFSEFAATRSKRRAVVVGSTAAVILLSILTVGAGAAAMGPMGTATSTSSAIINVGSVAIAEASLVPFNTGQVQLVRPILARAYIDGEHAASPVYAPSLFETVMASRYRGFGADVETATNAAAAALVAKAGFVPPPALPSDLRKRAGDRLTDHLGQALSATGAAK